MTNVIMPQMGESIAEGTVTKWMKKVGDRVQRDEPLFEISTDKVDAEIPAPASGVLREIRVEAGATVPINTVVAVIGEGDAATAAPPPAVPPGTAAPPAKAAQADGTPAPTAGGAGAPAARPAGPSTPPPTSASSTAPAPASRPAGPPTGSYPAMSSSAPPPAATPAPSAAGPSLTTPAAPPPSPPPPTSAPSAEKPRAEMTVDDLRQTRSSPVVRKIAAEHNVDISKVPGTGIAGRVTKQDILGHIEGRPAPSAAPAAAPTPPAASSGPAAAPTPAPAASAPSPPAPAAAPVAARPATPLTEMPTMPLPSRPSAPASAPAAASPATPSAPPAPSSSPAPAPAPAASAPAARPSPSGPAAGGAPAPFVPAYRPGERVEIVPMSPIRRKTAEHMVTSKRISAHVTTVFEMDMTRVDQLRQKYRQQYEERSGVKLTYMAFILKAAIEALKAFPVLNSSVEGESIVYKKDVNIGMAVALDWGLIVPVIRNADEKNVLGLARAVNDLAERARGKRLKVDEVQGGTFTITNPGVFGSLFGTPVINQPQVAILGIGTIEKRAIVRDDAIAIRTMSYFALSFDHRIVDGADADRFMAHIKKGLQEFDEAAL